METEALETTRALWDSAAATFDDAPDHGLRDPIVRAAWRDLLQQWLPTAPGRALDIGCGTGSISLLLHELGHEVTGIDLSPAMIAHARAKTATAHPQINFHVMDAAHPRMERQHFDILVCRHLLWTLPDRTQVLDRWLKLLTSGGRMILIEGFWHTGAGLHAQAIVGALPSSRVNVSIQELSDHAALWGGAVSDERYAVIVDYATQELPPRKAAI